MDKHLAELQAFWDELSAHDWGSTELVVLKERAQFRHKASKIGCLGVELLDRYHLYLLQPEHHSKPQRPTLAALELNDPAFKKYFLQTLFDLNGTGLIWDDFLRTQFPGLVDEELGPETIEAVINALVGIR
ncbi:MAG: hypothetical protein QNK37_20580 [Acidobacteriota bacterium]|nr:hypothetical protein [Acidobacteriota bacterium]